MVRSKKTHEFVIRVRFDKPCSKKQALAAVRDTIHGDFYPDQFDVRQDPGEFKVKSFKYLPKGKTKELWDW